MGTKKMSLTEFMADPSLGAVPSWIDDDFDITSTITSPPFTNHSNNSIFNNNRNINNPGNAKYSAIFENLPKNSTRQLLRELFESRYVKLNDCYVFLDPLNTNLKVGIVFLNSLQDLQKVCKWNGINIERSKISINSISMADFNQILDFNNNLNYNQDLEDEKIEKMANHTQLPQSSLLHQPQLQFHPHPTPQHPKINPFGNAKPIDIPEIPLISENSKELAQKLNNNKINPLKPISTLKPAEKPISKPNPFGNAKPVDTLKKQLEIEGSLKRAIVNNTTYDMSLIHHNNNNSSNPNPISIKTNGIERRIARDLTNEEYKNEIAKLNLKQNVNIATDENTNSSKLKVPSKDKSKGDNNKLEKEDGDRKKEDQFKQNKSQDNNDAEEILKPQTKQKQKQKQKRKPKSKPILEVESKSEINSSDSKSQNNSTDPKSEINSSDSKSQNNSSDPKSEINSSDSKSQNNSSDPKSEINSSDSKSQNNSSDPKSEINSSDSKSQTNSTDSKSPSESNFKPISKPKSRSTFKLKPKNELEIEVEGTDLTESKSDNKNTKAATKTKKKITKQQSSSDSIKESKLTSSKEESAESVIESDMVSPSTSSESPSESESTQTKPKSELEPTETIHTNTSFRGGRGRGRGRGRGKGFGFGFYGRGPYRGGRWIGGRGGRGRGTYDNERGEYRNLVYHKPIEKEKSEKIEKQQK